MSPMIRAPPRTRLPRLGDAALETCRHLGAWRGPRRTQLPCTGRPLHVDHERRGIREGIGEDDSAAIRAMPPTPGRLADDRK